MIQESGKKGKYFDNTKKRIEVDSEFSYMVDAWCVKYVGEDKDRKIINNSNNNNLMCIVLRLCKMPA